MFLAFTSFSRIIIIVCMSLFLLADLLFLIPKLHKVIKAVLVGVQALSTIVFLGDGSLVIYSKTQDVRILFLFLGQLLFIFVGLYFMQTVIEPVSTALLRNIFMLLSISFVMLERLYLQKAIKQFIIIAIGLFIVSIFLVILQKYKKLRKYYWVLGIVGLILLICVYLFGSVEYGAKLSIDFGIIHFQPSEFVKLSFIGFIAGICSKYKTLKGYVIATVGTILHLAVLALSKDFGSVLVFTAIYVFMLFVCYRNYIILILQALAGIGLSVLVYNKFSHIQTRFLAWSDPLKYANDEGYQISQSLFAIGTGGWFGSGIYEGSPKKIPVVAKDFIFAAISEEMGAIVALEIMAIYLCMTMYILRASLKTRDKFYSNFAVGFAVCFATQAILNMGGVTNFIPSTGITLPLISYGGSSLFATFIGISVVEAIEDLSSKTK